MTANVTARELAKVDEVVEVIDFAKRHGLLDNEQNRLVKLLGRFASKHEVLMNARRQTRVR